jgi:thiol:disulfide interchange protein DsbD
MRLKQLLLAVSFLPLAAFAQMQNPVTWSTEYKPATQTEGEIRIKAAIKSGWHLYSQKTDPVFLPLVFTWKKDACFERIGKTAEPKPHKDFYDDLMQGQARYFEKEVVFTQKIKRLTPDDFSVRVEIEGQACDDATGMCVQTPASLDIFIKGSGKKADCKGAAVPENVDSVPSDTNAQTTEIIAPTKSDDEPFAEPQKLSPEALAALDESCGSASLSPESKEERSFWGIFLAGFLGGFLALLTPCVFPMVPLTVSYFTKKSGGRAKGVVNALIYALSIIVIYTSLGFLVTKAFGPEALNQMATNAFFNLAFFVIFVVFAISFFGAFEITLPGWLVNKADNVSNRGGLIGIFFMAFTLSLVSFSCTGPIIGTLLVEAATGGSDVGPLVGMFGFSLALALPFALFAAFPGFLQSLPKSGGWLNSVKVVLGFLELALALKFISNVDLAYHWGILKREVFLALWIVIFGLLGLYLIGKLRFKSDTDDGKASIPGLLLGIFTFSFVFYLIPGLWGAPLRLISGFPPPDFYKEWTTEEQTCPLGLDCEHDYAEGIKRARRENKPVMLDFTGWNCPNCRRMEENVWPRKEVYDKIKDDFVLVSLYCDDKESLPAPEKVGERTAKTVGQKWSYFQQLYYNNNAQPFYVLLDHNGLLLAEPRGYTPNATEFSAYLEEGACRFKNAE